MKVIFASDTPILPEESRFLVGTDDDEYRFERQWLLPIKPRFEMEEGDPPSDWAVVSKILTAVSWNMRMDVGLRHYDGNPVRAYMNFPMRDGSYGQVKALLHLFGKTFLETTSLLKIKLGTSSCIQFAGFYYDVDDEEAYLQLDGNVEEALTTTQALKFLFTMDNDVQITWVESFQLPEAIAISPCARLLDTGYFADCHLVSNQDQDFPCHQVILKENSPKFEEEIACGNTKIKVDLSTAGVGALLRFLYCGTLDVAIMNWKLSLELLKVAHFLEIRKLWDDIVDHLWMGWGMEEPDMKTSVEVFQILVNSGKLDTSKDLGRKLIRIIAKKATVGDRAILYEYMGGRPFFDAWLDLSSAF